MINKPGRDTRHHEQAWHGRNPDPWRPEEADQWDIITYRDFHNNADEHRDREQGDRPLVDYASVNDHCKWVRNPQFAREIKLSVNQKNNRTLS
jgi:hypothetical protein